MSSGNGPSSVERGLTALGATSLLGSVAFMAVAIAGGHTWAIGLSGTMGVVSFSCLVAKVVLIWHRTRIKNEQSSKKQPPLEQALYGKHPESEGNRYIRDNHL